MIMRPRLAPRLLALLVGPGFLFVLGCSDDGLGKRYQETGKVTYNGAAVESGSISFVPEAPDGHGAAGQIKDGTYTLTTLGENDGALPGKYRVTVDTRQIDQAKAKEAAKAYAEKKGFKGEMTVVPQDVQAKVLSQTKSNIPGKYQIPETTDLRATIEEKPMVLDFELKD